jgi:hypothetical protein
VTTRNRRDEHGQSPNLSLQEINDPREYLLSL